MTYLHFCFYITIYYFHDHMAVSDLKLTEATVCDVWICNANIMDCIRHYIFCHSVFLRAIRKSLVYWYIYHCTAVCEQGDK